MFSRFILSIFLLTGLLSCGLHLGEKAPDESTLEFSGDEYSCVGQIGEKVELYINDKMSETEIDTFVRCMQTAFVRFSQLTHGSETGTYQPRELSQFIEKYFLKNKKISEGLLREFMVIKHVYLGGSLERVSKKDLTVAISILDDIRTEAIRMKPHIKVLNLRLLREQSPEGLGVRLREAQEALRQSIEVISGRLKSSKQAYHFANMSSFISEFRNFIDWDQYFPDSKPVESWIEFVKVFKTFNVANSESGVAAPEWAPLITAFSRWYVLALQYEVGVKNRRIISGAGFENTKFLADQAFGLLQDAIRVQPNMLISYGHIERLLMSLRNLDLLPQGVRVASVMTVTRAMLTKVFGDLSSPPEKRGSNGLTLLNLANMSTEAYRWIYIQMNINKQYTQILSDIMEDPNTRTPLLAPPLLPPEAAPRPGPIRFRKDSEQFSTEWADFMKVENRLRPSYKNGLMKVFLVNDYLLSQFKIQNGHYNLSMMNFQRSLVNLLFKGYSKTANPTWDSRITEDEVEAFYEDVRDLGIDFKVVDKRKNNSGRRSFLEANVFTYAADGFQFDADGAPFATLTEMVEYLGFLISGCRLTSELYDQLSKVCEHGPEDLYGDFKLNRRCVETKSVDTLLNSVENMPELKLYLSNLNKEQKLHYGKVFMDTAFDPGISEKKWVEYGELTSAAVVLHYQEAAMTRYDSNHDWVLDNPEVEVAARTFSGLIDRMARQLNMGSLDEDTRVAVLKYILAFHEVPMDGWSKFSLWMRDLTVGFPIHVDRTDMAEVFELIIQRITAPAPPPPKVITYPCGRGGMGTCRRSP